MAEYLIVIAIWLWGSYKGWKWLTNRNAWLDRKKTESYVVKGSICLVFGAAFGLFMVVKWLGLIMLAVIGVTSWRDR